MLTEPAGLVERWRAAPAAALAPAAEIETLLDGWDRICMLWTADDSLSARLHVMPEISRLAQLAAPPATSPDTVPGSGPAGPAAAPSPHASPPRLERIGVVAAASLVERNERVRARELTLDYTDE